MSAIPRLRYERFAEEGNLCSFGIQDFLVPAIEAVLPIAAGPAGILADIGIGAAAGAGLSALEGGKPGLGALTGGITGGAIGGLGGPLGDILGSTTAGEIAAGATGGLVGSAITGQPLLSGALTGAAAGGIAGLTGGGPSFGTDAPSEAAARVAAAPGQGAIGGGSSAASAAAPSAAAVPSQLDFTQPAPGGARITDVSGGPAGVSGMPIATGAAGGATVDGNPFFQMPGLGFTDLAGQNPNPVLGPIPAGVGGTSLAPGGAAAPSPGIGSLLGKLTDNPAAMIGLGGLALAGMKQGQTTPEEQALSQMAARQMGQANNMFNYANTGTLPPGMQEGVNLASASAKAQARQNFANLGLSGSTQEAAAIQAIDQSMAAQTAAIGNRLLQQGIELSQLSAGEFTTLLNATLQQDQAFQQALGNFAAGFGGARLGGGASPVA